MKNPIKSLLFIICFIILFIMVGNTVVNLIMSLMPMSAQEWFPLIKLIVWLLTFTFNLVSTLFITYFIAFIVSIFTTENYE